MQLKFKSLLLIFPFITCLSHAQVNCDAKYEVSAGPDIDVCEGGQVNLYGTMGGDANRDKNS